MESKHVWIICKYVAPKRYPRLLGIGKGLVAQGHTVKLITSNSNTIAADEMERFSGWKKKELLEGLEVNWLSGLEIQQNGIKRIFSWFQFEFKVLIECLLASRREHKPDIIVSSSLSLLSVWSGYFLAKLFKARFIFEVRDIWPLSLIELSDLSVNNPMVRFLLFTERWGYNKADAIVGSMPNLAEHVGNVSSEASSKVVCIPQGVDTAIFTSNSKKLSQKYIDSYIPKDKFIVAYTGTLNSNNPIDDLFSVAKVCAEKLPDIHFMVLGKGKLKASYEETYRGATNITFPPVIDKSQMSHFLSFVDIGYDAFASKLDRYGLSRNKWIDYMFNECMLICSSSGYQSMINEANCGVFVPYNDAEALFKAIEEIYNLPPEEQKKMGSNAKRFIEKHHTFTKLAEKYEALF